MKKGVVFFLLLTLFSCHKDGANAPSTNYSNTNANTNPVAAKDTSFIHVSIDSVPMLVTITEYDRSSSTVHLLAANPLQKVEVFAFTMWGSSGLNYQFHDTITYATRPDTLSNWITETAANTNNDLYFDCCAFPLKDSPVKGTFSANFGLKNDLFIAGTFHLLFK